MNRAPLQLRLLLLLSLLLPRPASALEATLGGEVLKLDLSEYGIAAYHQDNGSVAPASSTAYDPTGSGFADWLNRLQVDASWTDFTALLRLDTDLYLNAPVAAPGNVRFQQLLKNRYGNRADLEKVAVAYSSRHLELTLGDSYATYGRGLVLALRKEDLLGVDTTVRGVNATARVAGLAVNGIAGVSNVMNVDPATGRQANDPKDVILASRAEYRLDRYAVPGVDIAQFRYAKPADDPKAATRQLTAYSASLELPHLGPYGTAYVEYAQQRRLLGSQHAQGHGLYGSASGFLGPVTALVEYKDYRDFQPISTSLEATAYPELALNDFYDAPPTLERLQQAVLNNADVAGPHARVDVAVCSGFSPFVSVSKFTDRTYQADIWDPYAGLELRWQQGRSRAALSAGYRTERYNETVRQKKLVGQIFEDTTHIEYDINQALQGPFSIELDGLHMSHYDFLTTHYQIWDEGQAYLSLKRADAWAVAAGYEYYSHTPATTRTGYVNSSLSWNVTERVLLRLFAGGQRAGIKCVNGVCRNYPAFEGARAEVVAKY